jgi:hypothetical protein
MKRILTLLSLVAALGSSASLADFICWDGTFAYNAAGFFEKDNRFELTFRGASLGPLTFDFFDKSVAINRHNFAGYQIHIAFKKDECVRDKWQTGRGSQGTRWFCRSKANNMDRNVFVEHRVDDLGTSLGIISATQVDSIGVAIHEGHSLDVTFTDTNSKEPTPPRVQTVTFRLSQCGRLEWGGMDQTRFPERLETHLSK